MPMRMRDDRMTKEANTDQKKQKVESGIYMYCLLVSIETWSLLCNTTDVIVLLSLARTFNTQKEWFEWQGFVLLRGAKWCESRFILDS